MQNEKMTPERWKQVDRLMDAAFELPQNEIPEFLDSACAGDEGLREEMERLLAADQKAQSFIESRVLDGTTQSSAEKLFPTLTGSLNLRSPFANKGLIAERYQLVSKLGKGGMGEVWHAYDVRLRVDVALKSLHVDLRKKLRAVEALRREVRTARDVISPNVCRIFDLVVLDQDQELISMEYIDGITLFQLLGQSGPLDLRQARDIAAQFLSGMEAIHKAGLVHRDLKPENIMITRTGRVVVMDFGISQRIAQLTGTVAGTLPYMSPEQLSGSHIDGRSDLFAAGVVLAEMIHTKGVMSEKTRGMIWHAVRVDAKRIPDSPWKPVIMRAVTVNPEDRFQSVGALMRALEEVTQRVEGIEEQRPYPGLSAFTTSDAEYFFGREMEVETVIRKMQHFFLLAVVGPSGAGKTSFLRAGLLPALPSDWCTIVTTPGDAPILNLARSLSQSISNADQFEDPDSAVVAFQRLQQSRKQIVLIIDRFEELFTLNASTVQANYCNIIGRLSLEANIRVILAMRDDFLMMCKSQDSLVPIFSDLTAILPLTGAALRRALVQPALKCGYRFEDESMVDQILSELENERGALPLIAFAAARLWEKRDRQNGLLTRKAYREIGGVTGAISHYAEKVLEQMSPEKLSIVREIFRNLITAQNTRAARDVDELLSIFSDKSSAQEVLDTLINARLLTTFEAPSAGNNSERRVEIIHESLLSEWPRLVRWQTQDADAAQMRDQLRQAAQVWELRNRPEDLLWTGASFLEYQTWRQRYTGRLTANEEAFAHAMVQRAGKRKRQRRMALFTTFVVLLTVVVVISILWRNASVAKDEAILEGRRSEARRVIAVARSLNDPDPSTKLAYALRSLEFADNIEARQFAMQAISEGPAYHQIGSYQTVTGIQFSPNGKWLAASIEGGGVLLFHDDGSKPIVVHAPSKQTHEHTAWPLQFSPDSDSLLYTSRQNTSLIHVWSISKKRISQTFRFEGLSLCFVRGGKAFFITDNAGKTDPPFFWHDSTVRIWDFGPGELEILGQVNLAGNLWRFFDIDSRGQAIAYSKGNEIYISEFGKQNVTPARLVGTHSRKALLVRFSPDGKEIASSDDTGEIRIWLRYGTSKNPLRLIRGTGQPLFNFWFDLNGTTLMAAREGQILRWDLTAPEEAEPFTWKGHAEYGAFDSWQPKLAVSGAGKIVLYDDKRADSYVFYGKVPDQVSSGVRFTPDGKSFISGFEDDGLSIYQMPGEKWPARSRELQKVRFWVINNLDLDPSGRYVAVPTADSGVHLISISDSRNIQLKGRSPYNSYASVSFSNDGNHVAATLGATGQSGIEVWNVATGSSRIISNSNGPRIIKYSSDGTLFSGDRDGNLRRWNLTGDSATIISKKAAKGPVTAIAISHDGRYVGTSTQSNMNSELQIYDLRTGTSSLVTSHGNRVTCIAFDRKTTKLITGDADGTVRVGPITGETPNLLLGHKGAIGDVAVHPDGKWILSSESDRAVIRLWRIPEGKPLQTLTNEEFQTVIRDRTNVHVVADERLPGGYGVQLAPFPGWGKRTVQ